MKQNMIQPEIQLLIAVLHGASVDILSLPYSVADGLRKATQEYLSHVKERQP